jgi:flagellar hook-associated protein 2
MATIQFGGVASGLDTKSIISALMDAEKAPLLRLQKKQAAITSRQAAYATLGSSLTDFLTRLQAFTLTSSGNLRTATYADAGKLTATANTAAVPGSYQVRVQQLATATTATSTAAIGTAVTNVTAAGMMSTLPLPGSVTAGQVGVVVDGTILAVTIGSPSTTSLTSALDAIAAAIQAQVQATDPAATVTGSVVGNKASFAIGGATGDHTIHFGVASDTSNLLTLTGLSGSSSSTFGLGATSVAGSSLLGVVQAQAKLDSAGLTGLGSTAAGILTINGTTISYDTTVDSLNTVLARINNSAAGVMASIDRTNDRIVISRKTAGPTALDIRDTSGTLGAALKLAPGTTGAQVIGLSSKVIVDGTTVTSDTNRVTGAIADVTLDLVNTNTTAATLTVGVDASGIQGALEAMVASYNSLADTVDQLSKHVPGAANAPLEGEANVTGLTLSLRQSLLTVGGSFSGSIQSLADIGITTGSVGAKAGTTSRLNLDATKLAAALTQDAPTVGRLLGSSQGVLAPLVARLKSMTGDKGLIPAAKDGADRDLRGLTRAQEQMQTRIDARQAMLEAKFAALEAALAKSQSVANQLSAQVSSLSSGK